MKQQHEIKISYLDLCLLGNLAIPSNAQGLVIFVHGSGSSRFSPRNQYVAKALNHHKFSTLLFDLLTKEALKSVKAPTLLIVGELDSQVIKLNEQAQKEIGNQSKLVLVPGATHLFEEPGTLDTVNQLAVGWFSKYLPITEFS